MNNQEDILDEAISRLKKPSAKTEVSLNLPGFDNNPQLMGILKSLSFLPKNEIPQPAMQRKYALAPVKVSWLSSLKLHRLAMVGSSLLAVLALLTGTGYAASQSSPGSPLFLVKKTLEHLQVQLARDQVTKANLQVAIAQKRFSEAEVILNNPNSSAQEQKAALSELSSETENSVTAVTTVAKNNTLTQKAHPAVASLEKLAKQQQDLFKQLKTSPDLNADKQNALASSQNTVNQVAEVKKYIAAATAEQGLIKLETNPDAVAITGRLAERTFDNKITVEKTEFYLDDQTLIQDSSGNNIKPNTLLGKQRVSVLGIKSNSYLFAKQITLLDDSAQGQVKSAATIKNTSDTNKTATSTPQSLLKKTDSGQESDKTTDPNTVTGSFIFESPQPQNPNLQH